MTGDPGDHGLSAPVTHVIGAFDDSLVVIPIDEARRLANLNDALEGSHTWSQFRSSVGSDLATITYLETQYDGCVPDGDEPFDADEIPGFTDGSLPDDPKQCMIDWLPASVVELGTVMPTAFAPSLLRIDLDVEVEVIQALAAEGHHCVEDTEDLISRACGEWRFV